MNAPIRQSSFAGAAMLSAIACLAQFDQPDGTYPRAASAMHEAMIPMNPGYAYATAQHQQSVGQWFDRRWSTNTQLAGPTVAVV